MKNVQDIYPVSSMQELMLLHTLNTAGSDTLFNQFQFEINGAFDPRQFERAWQSIVDHHEALRTAFIWENVKQPLQVVRKSVAVDIPVEDLRDRKPGAQRTGIDQYLRLDRQKGFDLQRAPLMRFRLFRTAGSTWRFVWSSHHLILDRWCLGKIFQDLDRFYVQSPISKGKQRNASAPGYRQYIDWLSRQRKEETLAYWSNVLRGHKPTRSLFHGEPDDIPAGNREAASAELDVDHATTKALEEFSRGIAVTPGIVAQAAWSLTLNHLLGSQDVVFGLTVSGRPADVPDVESIVGSFINSVPVRSVLRESVKVSKWLRALQAEQFARSRHEYLSGAELKKGLTAQGVVSEFESLFVWLGEVGAIREIDMHPVSAQYATAFPLTISVLPNKEGIRLRADATQHFELDLPGTLGILADALRAIVRARADARIGELSLFRVQPRFGDGEPLRLAARTIATQPPLGKRIQVADVVGGRERLGTDVLRELIKVEWHSILGRSVTVDDDFFELGGSSLQAATLHSRLETATRQSIPMLALFKAPTIDGMVATLFAEDWPVRTDIVNCVRAGSGGAPLFCVASAEVNTVGYSLLARHLDDDQGLYVLQLPPQDNQLRQMQPSALPEVARRYLDSMRRVQPCGPYRMLGMCTGSHIALEMARHLEAEDERVEFLGIINTWALYSVSRLYYVTRLINIARYYVKRIRGLVPVPAFLSAAHAGDSQRALSLRAEVIAAEATEKDGNAWIHDVGFAAKNPGMPKITARVSVFRLKRQPQSFWRIRDASLGWSIHADDVDIVPIAGNNHDYLLREPFIGEIADEINERICSFDGMDDEPGADKKEQERGQAG